MNAKVTLPVFYIGKRNKSGELIGLTLGPYMSEKDAESEAFSKYGWGVSDYSVLKTEQVFEVVVDKISN